MTFAHEAICTLIYCITLANLIIRQKVPHFQVAQTDSSSQLSSEFSMFVPETTFCRLGSGKLPDDSGQPDAMQTRRHLHPVPQSIRSLIEITQQNHFFIIIIPINIYLFTLDIASIWTPPSLLLFPGWVWVLDQCNLDVEASLHLQKSRVQDYTLLSKSNSREVVQIDPISIIYKNLQIVFQHWFI